MAVRAGFPTSPEKEPDDAVFAADDMSVMGRRARIKTALALVLVFENRSLALDGTPTS